NFRAQEAGALPVAVEHVEQRHLRDQSAHPRRHLRVAEQLREYDRRHRDLSIGEGSFDEQHVSAGRAAQERDPRARVDRDQRSPRSLRQSIEKATLPRKDRSSSYAAPAATSSRPLRIVAVRLSPDDRCALSSKSTGSCTVIFRTDFIPPAYQLPYHTTIRHSS